jgi:fibronectin-binding autotransporter adhesin
VVVNATGLYDLNGFNETLGSLTLNGGGDVRTGAGTLTLNPTSTLVVAPGSVTNASSHISGFLNIGTGQRILDIGQGVAISSDPSDLVIDAVVSGSAEIVKTGAGQLRLNAANTFTGPLTLNEGALRLAHAQGLGATSAGTSVNGSAYLQLHGSGIHVGLEPLTLNSTYRGWGTLYSTFDTNSWAGDITLQSDAWIGAFDEYGLLELSGTIQGPGSLTKANVGAVLFSGSTSNSYGGTTYVREGTLRLNKTAANGAIPGALVIGDGAGGPDADIVLMTGGNQIHNDSAVTVNSSGLLRLGGSAFDAIGSLAGNGRVDLQGDLFVGFNHADSVFSGTFTGHPAGELNKHGNGTLTLAGTGTFPGWTYVVEGTLEVTGDHSSGPISVGANGSLTGTGMVGDMLCIGAIRPGTSPGILTCGHATLSGGTDLYIELNGWQAGTGYDQLNVRGTNHLASPFLHVSLGYLPAVGDSFVILNNDGAEALSGTFAFLPEGASLTASNATLRISYSGGTGNDVVLTVTNVAPVEPLRLISAQAAGTNLAIEWTGGVPFYVVQRKSALEGTVKWQDVTPPMRETQTNLPMLAPAGFYRVKGGN